MKNRNNKGFTLAELLIVVAIIGVIVSVSIPVFRGKKEKAMAVTDAANVRGAKSIVVTEYLSGEIKTRRKYYYDAENGILKSEFENIKKYGKSDTDLTSENILDDFADGVPKDGIIELIVSDDCNVKARWTSSGSGEKEGEDEKIIPNSWSDLDKSEEGIQVPAGSLYEDKGEKYIFHAEPDWYMGDWREKSLKELAAKFPKKIKKVDASTKIMDASELKKGDYVNAGVIAKTSDGKYLVRVISGKLSDEIIVEDSDNWRRIKGKEKSNI